MKKIIYIFIALLTFSVGIFVYLIRPFFVAVPLIELRNNITLYESQKIKVKGYFSSIKSDSGYIYYLIDRKARCDREKDVFCSYDVRLELPQEIAQNHFSLIQEISDKNERLTEAFWEKEKNGFLEQRDFDEHVLYRAEVEIVGYVQVKRLPSMFSNGNKFVDISTLRVEEMKIISPIKLVKVY